jgi:hypothetical protein
MDCSKRQAIEPVFGQLGSEPARIAVGEGGVVEFESGTCAHTLLLSKELCHVALPKGTGFGAASLGFVSGLRKWVMIWTSCPKTFTKRVASGRALRMVQEVPPVLVGRQI